MAVTLPEIQQKSEITAYTGQLPNASYRFQFNHLFKFADATALVPYLHLLGITHLHSSPIFKARPGSMHGYDTIDYTQLNPELGNDDDFNALIDTLHAHGMGLILDIVPNHMGIGNGNNWWMDVLENGSSSIYANYFDINWSADKSTMDKILLAILSEPYGHILEKGEIKLTFRPEVGRFTIHYYEHYWPVNPVSYSRILNHRRDQANLPESYDALIIALDALADESDRGARHQKKQELLEQLIQLCQSSPEVTQFIHQNVNEFNALEGNYHIERLHQLLEQQVYRLVYWRVSSDEVSYRRFFDVTELIGLNIEYPHVFEDKHKLVFQLIAEGKVSGLRIDHIDGLFDPTSYLNRLQDRIKEIRQTDQPFYIIVEKILAADEHLPEVWPVAGTTGYQFASVLNNLFVDSANEGEMTRIYDAFTDLPITFEQQVYLCKKQVIKNSLSSELQLFTTQLKRIAEKNWHTRDYTVKKLRQSLTEVVACFGVYRTYLTENSPNNADPQSRLHIESAVAAAKGHRPDIEDEIFDFIQNTLLMQYEEGIWHAHEVIHFAMKFQQFSSPVMAKGLEDTCFYRYNKLISMNDVGGDLAHFGLSVDDFHAYNQYTAEYHPNDMLTTSTHDSKRSEDVRARINVLSELPQLWEEKVSYWSKINHDLKSADGEQWLPDANDEYFLYQILLGVWPTLDWASLDTDDLQSRLSQYLTKALREAKLHTSWLTTDTDYEAAMDRFIAGLLADKGRNRFLQDFVPFQQKIAFWGMLNSLSQVLLKCTAPGIPDFYQGNEIDHFCMVDPDNRRPIDFVQREHLLTEVSWDKQALGPLKMFVTKTALGLRQRAGLSYQHAQYVPVKVTGQFANHLVAFIRQAEGKRWLVLAPRLPHGLCRGETVWPVDAHWGDTTVEIDGQFRNLFTDETVASGKVSDLLRQFPLGLFESI